MVERPAGAPVLDPTDRGDRGNVGIIRSPIRASILPDRIGPRLGCQFALQKVVGCSITSSAVASRDGGTVSPSAVAVLRLKTKSNVVDCWTGWSARFVSLRIISVYSPAPPISAAGVCPITRKAAGDRKLPKGVNCGNCKSRRQRHKLISPAAKERIDADNDCVRVMSDQKQETGYC